MQPSCETVPEQSDRRSRSRVPACWVSLLLACGIAGGVAEQNPGTERPAVDGGDVDYVAEFWRTEQGLPDNSVSALLQTRDGYLWVGTPSGLARFDGIRFTVLGQETIPVLEGARITALMEDQAGGLWVGMQERGLVRLGRGETRTFTRSQGLLDDNVTSLAEDADGVVWVGTQSGLNCWKENRLEAFSSALLRSGESIVALHAGRSGEVWLTTRFEVYRLRNGVAEVFEFDDMPQGRTTDFVGVYEDRAGDLWTYGATFLQNISQGKRFNYFGSFDPISSRFWTICEQENGAFWIGTSGRGLFRYRDGRFEITAARHGLDQCDVRALQGDHEGNLWVGTSGSGLVRLRPQQWERIRMANGRAGPHVTAVALGASGRMFVGTANGGVLQVNDQLQLEPLDPGPPLSLAPQVEALCTDAEGSLWVGTWGAGLFRVADEVQVHYTTANGLMDDVVLSLAAEETGSAVWAGTLNGGLHRVADTDVMALGVRDGLPGQPIVALRVESADQVLIGTAGGGLFRWDGRLVRKVPTPSDLGKSIITTLTRDQAGHLWVGTLGAGAFCRIDETWTQLGIEQGMVSDVIRQIVQDDVGRYWFNSDRGLFLVAVADMQGFLQRRTSVIPCQLYRREAGGGMMSDGYGFAPGVSTEEGRLWFAAGDGLLAVDPNPSQGALPPRVMIEEVRVNGEPMMSATLGGHEKELRIEPGMRSLDVAFTAISFTDPERTRFRHMLEGSDLDWVESNTDRREHYGPLAPGRYRFRVIAANADGIWNDVGDSVVLVVAAPFWRSWWFMAACIGAAIALVWVIARYVSFRRLQARLRISEQRRAMERERARIAQDMHDEIGSKLTRISFLSEAVRNAGAEASGIGPQVTSIATTSRELLQALDEIVWAVNPRNDNLEHLAGYLEQYARDYFQGTSIECRISVPDRFPPVSLGAETRHNVFLAFEEALSNVLRHSSATEVRVEMRVDAETFELVVGDNGAGFSGNSLRSPVGHDGLRNMKERLHSIGGACRISSKPSRGTTIQLRVPCPPAGASRVLKGKMP